MSLDDDQKNFGNAEIPEGWLDLRLGNPLFLKGYWDDLTKLHDFRKHHLKMCVNGGATVVPFNKNMEYPSQEPNTGITCALFELHHRFGNLKIGKYDDFKDTLVIGNGANHLLLTVMMAIKDFGVKSVFSTPPYWPRFNNIAQMAGLSLHDQNMSPFMYENNNKIAFLYTTPNNPDGKTFNNDIAQASGLPFVIADLNYNWPLYTDEVFKSDAPVSIFGLSKMTGHASTRFGWAVIKDKKLLERVRHYVELTTSGVSVDIVSKATDIVEHVVESGYRNSMHIFEYGRMKLNDRWDKIQNMISDDDFEFRSESGMFLYGRDKTGIFQKAKVLGVSGSAFGEGQENYIRINMGCSDQDFTELLRRLDEVRQSINNKNY
jgi:aspartate/methionine/tyrosine aminotransferase